MTARLATWDEAVGLVGPGATVAFGGAVLRGKPIAAARALAEADARELDVVAFAGSLEVEILLAAGVARSVASSYVGLGPYGRARRFAAAVAAGEIEDRELSEWMLVGGLRAAAMGLPFLPTRAALGSELASERGLRVVRDPYSGEELLAVPALRPDVAFIHAWRADGEGNVQLPWPPDHLWDVDVLLARASRSVVVGVEEVVPRSVLLESPERTKLFGFEVALVVEAPRGAWPTALPPLYDEDPAGIASCAEQGASPLERREVAP